MKESGKSQIASNIPYVGFDTNKWCYNLLILNVYIYTQKVLKFINERDKSQDKKDELIDLETLISKLENCLDPLIRRKLRKVGLCITQNVYQGFDTEYESLNQFKNLNELLSIQLAANTKISLKIPVNKEFKVEYLHPLTSEVKGKDKPILKSNGFSKIEKSIDKCIKDYRILKHPEYDAFLTKLVEVLRKSSELKSIEVDDHLIFVFPYTLVKEYFKYTKVYSLKELVSDTDKMIDESLKANNRSLSSVIEKGFESDLISSEKLDKAFNKGNSRFTISLENGERLFITTRLNLILVSHLSNADLSMLSDFEEFKHDLTIVSKSFVMMGKGFKKFD